MNKRLVGIIICMLLIVTVLPVNGISLKDIPEGEYVVFFLRDPVSRFISGFYSRKRKGQPRYYYEWIPAEELISNIFRTPNELAVSLADDLSKDHSIARMAMENIQHFRPYKQWYGDIEYFHSRIKNILFVGFQE